MHGLARIILLVLADAHPLCFVRVLECDAASSLCPLCWVGRMSRRGSSFEAPMHPAPAKLYVFSMANAWREPGDGCFGAPGVDGLNARSSQDPPSGISGAPCDNDIMKWSAVIFG